MSVSNVMATALWNKLSADSTLTGMLSGTGAIYRTQAGTAPMPYVVYSQYAGGPLNITKSDLRDPLYFVRAYASTMDLAGSIDARVSGLLHHGTLTVSGYTNYWLARESDVELPQELPNGQNVFMAGGVYRISLTGD